MDKGVGNRKEKGRWGMRQGRGREGETGGRFWTLHATHGIFQNAEEAECQILREHHVLGKSMARGPGAHLGKLFASSASIKQLKAACLPPPAHF